MVCHALDVKGLLSITRQGFAMHYTSIICHALHGKGLPCITRQGFALHCTARVCPALHGKGLLCITRQGFVMRYTARVCHALHVKGLLCITRQGFAMHYTSRVCHALHGKALPCIARQGFAVHYWPTSCTMAQTMHWTLLGCVERLTGRFYRCGGELARIFLWWTLWRTAVQFVLGFEGCQGLDGFSVVMRKPCFSECRHADESEKQKDEGTHAWHD